MKDVVIAGYLRTAQSRSRPGDPDRDLFGQLRGDDLLAGLIAPLLERAGVVGEDVDDFIVGSALGVTEGWTYGGRTPVFLANLPETVPAKFLDQQCGSGMAAIHTGYLEIAGGMADVVIAAGMEHMTRVPMGPPLFKSGVLSVNERLYTEDQYAHWDMPTALNMGLTAEKLFEKTSLTRADLDQWGARSHQRAAAAYDAGFFKDEILPISAPQADGSVRIVDRDAAVRADATAEKMAGLRPVFKPDGVITAGNASPLNAGAAATVLMSAETARQREITPLGTIRSAGIAGVDPTVMGEGPVPAVRRALAPLGLTPADIDCWEINEAFAVVALYAIEALGIDPERVNVMGGGIAIGHALGATGVRLTGTLARILAQRSQRDGRFGCAAACIGGGQGIATIIEATAGA